MPEPPNDTQTVSNLYVSCRSNSAHVGCLLRKSGTHECKINRVGHSLIHKSCACPLLSLTAAVRTAAEEHTAESATASRLYKYTLCRCEVFWWQCLQLSCLMHIDMCCKMVDDQWGWERVGVTCPTSAHHNHRCQERGGQQGAKAPMATHLKFKLAGLVALIGQGVVVEAAEHQANLFHLGRVQRLCLGIVLGSSHRHKLMPRHVHCCPLSIYGVVLGLVCAFSHIHLVGCLQVELVGLPIAFHSHGNAVEALQVQV